MKLRLKGAKGTKAGPSLTWNGLDEIEIDFTGKQGLIAISGENGTGKTVCLESLSHFPQFVSRDGALWQGFMGREAEKEFISTFMGHEYRSVIKMDADQGKQEGYLWIDGKPSVNGKITAYKEMVNSIFGQPFTYFRSQFCPQKSKKTRDMQIENMTAGVFRELLREFLGLQRYERWEDTAKQAGNFYQGRIAGMDQQNESLFKELERKAEIELAYGSAGDKAAFLQGDKTLLIHTLEEKRQAIDALKATIQANTLALERRKDIQAQIDLLEGELKKEKAAAEAEINALAIKYREVQAEIKKSVSVLADRDAIEKAAGEVALAENAAADIQGKIDHLSGDLPKHQQVVHDLETTLAGLRQQVKDLDNDPENLRMGKIIEEAERAVKEREKEDFALDNDFQGIALHAAVLSLEKAAEVGDGIDADCKSVTCAAIKSVTEAKEKIPIAQRAFDTRLKEIEDIRTNLLSAIKDIKECTAKVLDEKGKRVKAILADKLITGTEIDLKNHDLKNAQQMFLSTNELLAMHRADLAKKREEIAKQKALADRLPDIRIAEERKKDLEKQLEEVTTAGTERKRVWSETEAAKRETIKGYHETMGAIFVDDTVKVKLDALYREVGDIETVKIPAVETEIQAARDRIATLQAELRRIEAAETELAQVRNQRDLLTRNMTSWRYLQFGCGKTGLQNLRIDGAAPRIVYNANRLLSQAYGALYSIRLETINEAGKEDLQVKIIMENGQEVYLDDISGGQRAWNVQALWLAMSLLNQEKSGRKYDYFCSDESDGALDTENAEKYTALYRPFMAQAELSQLIYISHKESCRAMADHQLTFAHGKNPSWG